MKAALRTRHGTILPMLAVCCFSLFAFIALAVDLGMLMIARTECQNAADSAALAGARTLDNDVPDGVNETSYDNKRPQAITVATSSVKANYLMQSAFAFSDSTIDKVEVGIYDYDSTAQVFAGTFPASNPTSKINNRPWTAVRVTVKGDQPTYFARIFGVTSMPMLARATAVHRPRDISMVLDYSGSMKFGCTSNYPPGNGSSNGAIIGLLNPDPRFPRFGHYQRYDTRSSTTPNGTNQHPFQTTVGYQMASGEICSPNNQTYDIGGSGGPPMVEDFYMLPGGTATSVVSSGSSLVKAFTSPGTSLPASNAYAQQTFALGSNPVTNGDRWPRLSGARTDDPTMNPWNDASKGAARNVSELLFGTAAIPAGNLTPTGRSFPTMTGPPTGPAAFANGNTKHWGSAASNFLDIAWETYGYDLDIVAYKSNPNAATTRTTEQFNGFTMGPGYWGKSFFMWPPDPRFDTTANVQAPNSARLSFDTSNKAMCDWRRRFFLKFDGTAFNPQVDDINALLFRTPGNGSVLNVNTTNQQSSSGTYRVNYPAVLAWIKSGVKTLPDNLRAGRILFYATIPNDCTNPADDDQRFWREYIDYVLGCTVNRSWYDARYSLAGTENTNLLGGAGLTPAPLTGFRPTGALADNPKPYMCYTDTPNLPRAHFWFGPSSMLNFISTRGQFTGSNEWNYNPGTCHESQTWQLKAAIQSSLDDIRKNHPNDQVGMSFFAYSNFRTTRCAMGQDWDRLKAALFYPNTFLDDVLAGNPREERPYNTSMSPRLVGNIPNANGGTDPNNGLALAYNMFSASTSGASGAGGRRGATKIVIFETDGVPNSYQNWDFVSNGINSKYNWIDAGSGNGNGDTTSMNEAYAVVSQIAASTTSANPGFSLPNSPARVYPIGFGDMFTSNSPFLPTAKTFLQTIAFNGNTNTSTSTPLPTDQIITGDYNTRISNMRSGLERMLQNGVQVTLIE